jgi:outer membrane receptor protein involved in Fe transport
MSRRTTRRPRPLWALALALALAAPTAAGAQEPDEGLDVLVQGQEAPSRRSDVEAVEVLDTQEAQQESADMGSVLNRAKGVKLRRNGGLGTPGQLSIHGLYGKRIRFFVDGVPASLTLLGGGTATLPVHLIRAVEVYKGVVPVRFGADALGGAVNFTTPDFGAQSYLDSSLELASFGTLRGSTTGRAVLDQELGLFLDLNAFFDQSDNDYPVQVEVTNAQGKLSPATVRRFHDGYQGHGASASLGVMGRPWADRLSAGVFLRGYQRQLQHNLRMTLPYGDVHLGQEALGADLRYRLGHPERDPWSVELLLNHAHSVYTFTDVSRHIWNWYGEIINTRANPGEASRGSTIVNRSQQSTARLNLTWRPAPGQQLTLGVLPSWQRERRRTQLAVEAEVEPRVNRYKLLKVASGASWRLRLWERFEGDLFVKHFYTQPGGDLSSVPAGVEEFALRDHQLGGGQAMRLTLWRPVHLKASYEYAVRVPDPEELFGDGGQIIPNTGLRGERSHNLNLGINLDPVDTALGQWSADAQLFLRNTRDQIFLTVILDSARYENISDVDTPGVEAQLQWVGWRVLTLGGNVTWLDPTNESTGGFFGRFKDERIPNLPWLLANANAALAWNHPTGSIERLRLYWYGHYVHQFFLFWESEGITSSKLKVPSYFSQDAGVSCRFVDPWVVANLEVQNLTDETLFDNVGVQLPGRSYHFKMSMSLD